MKRPREKTWRFQAHAAEKVSNTASKRGQLVGQSPRRLLAGCDAMMRMPRALRRNWKWARPSCSMTRRIAIAAHVWSRLVSSHPASSCDSSTPAKLRYPRVRTRLFHRSNLSLRLYIPGQRDGRKVPAASLASMHALRGSEKPVKRRSGMSRCYAFRQKDVDALEAIIWSRTVLSGHNIDSNNGQHSMSNLMENSACNLTVTNLRGLRWIFWKDIP